MKETDDKNVKKECYPTKRKKVISWILSNHETAVDLILPTFASTRRHLLIINSCCFNYKKAYVCWKLCVTRSSNKTQKCVLQDNTSWKTRLSNSMMGDRSHTFGTCWLTSFKLVFVNTARLIFRNRFFFSEIGAVAQISCVLRSEDLLLIVYWTLSYGLSSLLCLYKLKLD